MRLFDWCGGEAHGCRHLHSCCQTGVLACLASVWQHRRASGRSVRGRRLKRSVLMVSDENASSPCHFSSSRLKTHLVFCSSVRTEPGRPDCTWRQRHQSPPEIKLMSSTVAFRAIPWYRLSKQIHKMLLFFCCFCTRCYLLAKASLLFVTNRFFQDFLLDILLPLAFLCDHVLMYSLCPPPKHEFRHRATALKSMQLSLLNITQRTH